MYNVNDFILSTDYATLKNDNNATIQVTFPGSTVVPASVGVAGSAVEVHTDVTMGAPGAISRIQISSTKDAGIIHPARNVYYNRTGDLGSYQIVAFTYRTSPTTLRCSAFVTNPYNAILTTEAGDETFTFYVNTFLPPFAS